MNKLHFKGPWYNFYAPYRFKFERYKALRSAINWQLKYEEQESLINYRWDRFLSQQFYKEVPYYSGIPFNIKNIKKDSDTIFILGCGSSINDLTLDDWDAIKQHDSVGVNYFYAHEFKPTFHMVELGQSPLSMKCINKHLLNVPERKDEQVLIHLKHLLSMDKVFLSDQFDNVHLYSPSVPKGTNSSYINHIISHWYQNQGHLIHHASNLDCTVHLAYQMGYKRIFLLGVDLNNNQYFWDEPKTPTQAIIDIKQATQDDYNISHFNSCINAKHATANKVKTDEINSLTIIEYLSLVNNSIFKQQGVQFATCSPLSLLRETFNYISLKDI